MTTTIDEQLAEFMKGWHIGAMPTENGDALVEHYQPKGMWTKAMERGFRVARAACETGRKHEQERLAWEERYGSGLLTQEEGILAQSGDIINAVKAYRLRMDVPLKVALEVVRAWRSRK